MRILMLAQFYPPVIGGEERLAHDLSVQLVARGHRVAVITLAQAGLPDFQVEEGVRVYRVSGTLQRLEMLFSEGGRRHTPPFPDPELVTAMRRIVVQEKPDVVHAHNWIIHSFLPLKAWSGARLLLTMGDYSFVCAKKKLIYQDAHCSGPGFVKCLGCASDHYGALKGIPTTLANWTMGLAERGAVDLFLPVSQAVAEHNGLIARDLPYRIIPPLVPDDLGTPRACPESYLTQLPAGDFLLFVGAFGRYKGVDVLLQAHARLENPPPLVIIGYQTAESPVQTTDLPDNVIVLKDWPHRAVMAAWERCAIGLAPSTWAEPFGIVALEAMAMGHPVIASAIGGLTEMVDDGVTGLLVSPGDVEALRGAMQRLIADPALRDRMGAAGKRRVADFSASAIVPRYELAYHELLQNRDAAQPAISISR